MKNNPLSFSEKSISLGRAGFLFFRIGIFLLPSAVPIAGFALLLALIVGSYQRVDSYLSDKWNYPFLISGILMIISSTKLNIVPSHLERWDPSLSWIGLLNWIPYFWCFWGFQTYLSDAKMRQSCAICFVTGSIPVLITGFGQYWLGWHGPFETFNGLIVWFQRPLSQWSDGLTGLFNNANYAGSWLTIVWPFCLALLLQSKLTLCKKSISWVIAVGVFVATILTTSRNSITGLMIAIPFTIGSLHFSISSLLTTIIIVSLGFVSILPFASVEIQEFFRSLILIPKNIWAELTNWSLNNPTLRTNIWSKTIGFIIQRPIFGWGAASLTILYRLKTGMWVGHAHNLPLNLAVSYGLPVSLLFTVTITILLFKSSNIVFYLNRRKHSQKDNLNSFDRAWWTSSFILVLSQLADVQYFDGRIAISFWILFAGLRCMVKENSVKYKKN